MKNGTVPTFPTHQAKKRGVMVFAALIIAGITVTTFWPYEGRVTAPPRREPYAATLYREKAEQGDAAAMYLFGTVYLGGTEIPRDLVEAHKWFNLAASRASAGQYSWSAAKRKEAAAGLTPQQVATAQARAREWLAAFEKRSK